MTGILAPQAQYALSNALRRDNGALRSRNPSALRQPDAEMHLHAPAQHGDGGGLGSDKCRTQFSQLRISAIDQFKAGVRQISIARLTRLGRSRYSGSLGRLPTTAGGRLGGRILVLRHTAATTSAALGPAARLGCGDVGSVLLCRHRRTTFTAAECGCSEHAVHEDRDCCQQPDRTLQYGGNAVSHGNGKKNDSFIVARRGEGVNGGLPPVTLDSPAWHDILQTLSHPHGSI